MNKIIKTSLTLFCLLFSITVFGQKLTIEQCRAMALENNKRIAIAQQDKERADLIADATKTNFLPKVSVEGLAYYDNAKTNMKLGLGELGDLDMKFKTSNSYVGQITVEQPIYMGGKITSANKMSKVGSEIAELSKQLTEDEIILETDKAYWLCIQALEMRKATLSYKVTIDEFYRVVQNAVGAGMKSKNDAMKVQVQKNQAELQLSRAENGIRISQMNLCDIIGLPLDSNISFSETFKDNHFVLNPNATVSARPEYALLTKQIELKKHEKQFVKGEFLPQIGFAGSYGYIHGPKLGNDPLFNTGTFSAVFSVKIPLFNWGEGTKKVRAVEREMAMAQLQKDDLSKKMDLELQQAINAYNEAILEVKLTYQALKQSEENLKMSRDHYDVGMETISDYLESQTIWQNAQTEYIVAKTKLEVCKSEYLKAIGKI
ncbi:TolC family protein [Bacteroides thetaiotaomicron]|uniref:TolC family protein n=1 Tax=Bacteroides thetaiotaomicron TaxID=818 RepID=UPI0021656405|nr:TolC family protein [Bacteroides thetaiotaomicron]MCS2873856.1 TolC family protein [Bacteroides thetaiotaomicron]MDL2215240.1 TolC family protein [Dysgonomonas sp. OttesenSCG-928-M03]